MAAAAAAARNMWEERIINMVHLETFSSLGQHIFRAIKFS